MDEMRGAGKPTPACRVALEQSLRIGGIRMEFNTSGLAVKVSGTWNPRPRTPRHRAARNVEIFLSNRLDSLATLLESLVLFTLPSCSTYILSYTTTSTLEAHIAQDGPPP